MSEDFSGPLVFAGDKKEERDFIIEFISLYRSLPALWDVKCIDYNNRAKKKEQYDVLVRKYREKYPSAEKENVVKKINSLRTNFRKELKRIRGAQKFGYDTKDEKHRLWYFEEMRFLIPQEETITTSSIKIDVEDVYSNEDWTDSTEDRDHAEDDEIPRNNSKRAALDSTGELTKFASERHQQTQDDYDKIAAAWAVELRRMDPQQQLFAKKAINDILFEGQMGTLHRNSVEINVFRPSEPYCVRSLSSTPPQ
ncbi:uncharacterized protein LOC108681929 [Hyalella azteca]|uniref:Uncharacterized protein LOC108681929 n=1 Tax=Hyalella azteca TaxID=294128 RepID=A0A8B7PK05_HYAAZ|nr:uncharacterized protein LOC108681929 [Hyalella azteca]